MKITKENIKDLEVVLALAISSEYLDDSNHKNCDRVEKLIEELKQVKNDDSLHSVSERILKDVKNELDKNGRIDKCTWVDKLIGRYFGTEERYSSEISDDGIYAR